MPPTGIDVIGDVHGRSAELRALLARLGYRERGGAWRHPSREALFMGDLVDRGPGVGETLALVRAMVDAGSARMVLGNHELNLLRWFTADGRGGHLRTHDARRRAQAGATLAWCEARPAEAAEALRWFQDLPLFLEAGGARFVHACWHPADAARIGDRRTLRQLDWTSPAFRESPEGRAVETLLKGPEVSLPAGTETVDADGHRRREVRLAWWEDPEGHPYAAPGPGEGPVFIGHYTLPGTHGALHPRVACVDFGGPGAVGAYRWDGEGEIHPRHFVH